MSQYTVEDIRIELCETKKAKIPDEQLGFGTVFTDHMFLMDWTAERGWHDARIVAYQPFVLDPATAVLHYGQSIFEGLKAYKSNGQIRLFRPDCNFARLNQSADRMALPLIDEGFALIALKKLIEIEQDWIPSSPGMALYIRPYLFCSEVALSLHAVKKATYAVILSPSGAYFSSELEPTKIYVEEEYVRAVRGGVGYAKTAGNYAAACKGQNKANEHGYAQSLWLDGVKRKYIEEVGAMNVFFKINGTYVTPALNGSILDGITRRSVIQLLQEAGETVEERAISIDELLSGIEDGSVEEMFGTGTAAIITAVGELYYKGKQYVINNFQTGPATQQIYKQLTDIQYGNGVDTHGWSVVVCETQNK